MSWTVVTEGDRIHVRAIIDTTPEMGELLELIASLQKHTNKEPSHDGPTISRITSGAQEAATKTST